MNAQQITQIAQHLNISPNQVKEVQEWAYVYFVKFTKGSPRFVSKKVVKPMESIQFEALRQEFCAKILKIAPSATESQMKVTFDKLLLAGTSDHQGKTISDDLALALAAIPGKYRSDFRPIAKQIFLVNISKDKRSKETARLDSIYGVGNWGQREYDDLVG